MQSCTDKPLCIDSPDAGLLAQIIGEGLLKRPGMVNTVNEEGDKCERIFPLIAGTPWEVVGLTCDLQPHSGRHVPLARKWLPRACKSKQPFYRC